MKQYSRVCAHINLDHLEYNLDSIKNRIAGSAKVMAVIKTNGYGHGAVELAKIFEQRDEIYGYAVAAMDEAEELIVSGIRKPMLILGYVFPEDYERLVHYRVRPAVFSLEMAKGLSKEAVKQNCILPIHIKLDTGMSRIGFQINEESAHQIMAISKLPNIMIEGIFTHFSRADETDKTFTREQVKSYEEMICRLEELGLQIPVHHVSNSAGIMDLPEYQFDLVRAGIILYGLWPSDEVKKENLPIKPILSLKSHVAHVKELTEGRLISYGGTYTVSGTRKIATVPVGYGDGYPRTLSNCGHVLIHGKKAPICGRICMDQFMVDVTEIPDVNVGDEVTLIGQDGDEEITMDELGALSGRFNYEFACDLGRRIPRIYEKNGQIVAEHSFLLH